MEKAGIHLDVMQEEDENIKRATQFEDDIDLLVGLENDLNEYEGWTKAELDIEMKKAVQNEDYELAARLRDQIDNMEN